MATEYRTVVAEHQCETAKIKGSRFIATLVPMGQEDEVATTLAQTRLAFPAANHHCWAYRLGLGADHFRYSDDGEPSGSAGRPILQQIDGHAVTNVLLVVSRIFGGTKLGVGGLVRAYGGAAAAVLESADIRTVILTKRVVITCTYEQLGTIKSRLHASSYEPTSSDFGARIILNLDIPEGEVEIFCADILERTAGQADIEVKSA